ncbi:MAG: hypothetical protein KAS07_04435, partial [Candidatus Pacebacteria bacterium]|nr:hypothetical protein [Candidatus Paceibacterota bacterium]
MKKTTKDKGKKRVSMTILFGVLCAAAFLAWVGHQVVIGKEDKHIFIFPTEVSGQGWKNIEASYSQSVGGSGGFESFSESNSAFIFIEGQEETFNEEDIVIELPETAKEEEQPAEIESAEGIAEEIIEERSEGIAEEVIEETVEEEQPVEETVEEQEEENTEDMIEETVEEEQPAETEGVEEIDTQTEAFLQENKDNFLFSWVKDSMVRSIGTQVFAQESTEGESVEEYRGEKMEEEPAQEQEDMSVCTISGKECYTMQFAGFDIGNSLSESKINNVQLRFSFASKAPIEDFSDDTFIIRYFYNDSWYIAGEFSLEGELSNVLNGGHFLYALPKFGSWDELEDLKIEFEYNRNSTGPIDLFIDSVWLEAMYEDVSEEDDLAGQENISYVLKMEDGQDYDNTLLPANSGNLVYTDNNDGEELIIKTEKRTYAGLTNNEILFSVTNTNSKDDEFQLQIHLPEKYGEVNELQQWMHYVPVRIEEAKFGTSAYFCNSGWESQEEEKHKCLHTGESYVCGELSQDGTNCIVEDVYVGSEVRTGYKSTWRQEPFVAGEITSSGLFTKIQSLLKKKDTVLSSLEAKAHSADTYRIGGGQTLYFKMSLEYPIFSNGEFVIEAIGKDGYGLLDPWWDSHWKKQVVFSVNSEYPFNVTQAIIDIDNTYTDFWSTVRHDGGDMRFMNENG